MEKNTLLFERKSNAGLLMSLSLPAVLLMLVMTVYHMTDVFFIGKLGDVNKLAAVSLAAPILGLQTALGTLIGDGASSLTARALGAKNGREKSAAGAALLFSAGTGVLLGAGTYFLSPFLLPFLGGTEATVPYALSYLRILAFSAPAGVFTTAFANIVRSTGAVKEGMTAHLLGTAANMILDPVFILLLGMEVKGAALATALGNILAAFCLLHTLLRKKGETDLRPKTVLPAAFSDPAVFPRILALGLPSAAGNLLMNLAGAVQNHFLSGYGEEAIAAFSIGGKAGMIIAMTAMGICVGMQPAFGYFCGAGNRERLNGCLRLTALTACIVSVGMMAALLLGGKGFIGLFTDEPALSALALSILRAGVLSAPVIGFYYLSSSYLQASGQAAKALVVSILRQGAVMIPALLLLNAAAGLNGIIWCGFVTDLISAVFAGWMMKSGKKALSPALSA